MIIKLNNKICKDKDEAIDLIENSINFKLLITLENGDEYGVENSYGTQYWSKNGKLHREDGPAVIYKDGAKYWYKGTKYWYLNGLRHREDGPAIESTNGNHWYKEGKLHREDGPAVDMNGTKKYFFNGIRLYDELQLKALMNSISQMAKNNNYDN